MTMKAKQLMALAFCTVACIAAAVAEEDFGIESATAPVKISDPVNPKPGALFSAYNNYNGKGQDGFMEFDQLMKIQTTAPNMPALITKVDLGSEFNLSMAKDLSAQMGRWEGFLKCKLATTYTFQLRHGDNNYYHDGYVLYVNGKLVICNGGSKACDVTLKTGWNKIDIFCQFWRRDANPLIMSYKPKGSPADPRPMTPAMMFYDDVGPTDW